MKVVSFEAQKPNSNRLALFIASGYLVLALLWIAFSDQFVAVLAEDSVALTKLQTQKGWLFVLVTGLVLFVVLRATFARLAAADHLLRESFKVARESAIEAERANQAKSDFLLKMSHEVRTPLGAIKGFTELLNESAGLSDEQKDWASAVLRNTSHLTQLIDEILDISKLESKNLSAELVEFAPSALVDGVKTAFTLQAKAKGLKLEVASTNALPARAVSDPSRIHQILKNVVGNAIKFTEKGQVDVHFHARSGASESDPWTLLVEVRDTGIGITKEQERQLFLPFHQGDNSLSRKYGGTGLGLYLSRRVARLLGGDLVLLRSEPLKETVFQISIAITPAAAVSSLPGKLPDVTIPSALDAPVLGPSRGKALETIKILLVEDSIDNQLFISRLLTKEGALVTVADNGASGIEKATAEDFDLVLMDIQMPEVDGYEAVRRLRAQSYPQPIVALTAHAMGVERDKAMAVGFDGFLTKPVNRATLVQAITELVDLKNAAGI